MKNSLQSPETVRSGRHANFFIIENAFIDDWAGVLGSISIAVYCCLWRHADRADSTFIGTPKLAEKLKLSPRAMQRAIKTLADHKLIRIDRTTRPVGRTVFHMLPVPSPAKGLSPMPLFDSVLAQSETNGRRKAGDCTGAKVGESDRGQATAQARAGDCTGADLLMEQDTLNKTKILKPSPDGAGEKPTSNPSRSKVRGRGKSLSKSSHRSGESSTDRGKENSAGAPAAKPSSPPGELIVIPPASSPSKETRHAPVERFIKSTYQEANDGVDCAWNGRAGKALKDFLTEHASSSWPIEKITQCVANRFKSDGVSVSADPHSWISDLASFLQGPKDRFGKTRAEFAAAPKTKAPRAVVNLPPLIAQPDKVKALARWKEPISPTVSDDESLGFLEEPLAIGRTQ
jgi:hypothetical protein